MSVSMVMDISQNLPGQDRHMIPATVAQESVILLGQNVRQK